MRVVALLATYNERRFVGDCIEHLAGQGVETYLIDNGSTDGTVEIAERYLGRGVVGIEEFPREDVYDWCGLLRRKEELARELDADWLIHVDADELRLPPPGRKTLVEAFEEVELQGYNAVNFLEFTFMPTREAPDHDHRDFRRTLRSYYPFSPTVPHQLKAWRKSDAVDLTSTGGHKVRFPGVKMYPQSFPMKHYLFLGVEHAIEKYVEREYDPAEIESGWHGWRARLTAADIQLPRGEELRVTRSDTDLDPSNARRRHHLDELISPSKPSPARASATPPPGFHVLRSKPREETAPSGNPGEPKIVHRGGAQRAEIALTFDDGPSRWTAEIASCFEEHGCHATFFLRGTAVVERPEAVAALAAAGHELGNHLWSHPHASSSTRAQLREEIERTADAIEAAGAPRPDLVRPPYFDAPHAVAEAAGGTGVEAIVLRSIGSSDWEARSAAEVVEPVLTHVQAGDIVCLHDGISSDKRDSDSRQPTVDAVKHLVPTLLQRGLRPVTVSVLLAPS